MTTDWKPTANLPAIPVRIDEADDFSAYTAEQVRTLLLASREEMLYRAWYRGTGGGKLEGHLLLDGFVEQPTGPQIPPPMPEPDPFYVRASALVLLSALIGAGFGVNAHPDHLEVSATAVFIAIVLFLVCLGRYDLGREQ